MTLAPGTILAGRYRILTRLGEGGMGSVYQAEDLRLPGRMWAIKELVIDPQTPADEVAADIKRFDAEIELMARLSNPRIPGVVDRFQQGAQHFFVMDFIPGSSLETRLAQAHGPLPERDVLGWTVEVCEVLAYIHAQHPPIILRDLKPANIMVTPSGEVRLIDFGIARTYKLGQASNTENLGTLMYASPEHVGRSTQTDARSDIYSLGATVYHLLTNSEPAPMETPLPGSLRRLNPGVSEAAERVVIRAMQLDPARRFQTASEMRDALLACPTLASAHGSAAPGATHSGSHATHVPSPPAPGGRVAAGAGHTGQPMQTAAAGSIASPNGTAGAPHLARVQGGVICPRCGHLNRSGARFCSRDGVPLAGAASAGTPVGVASRVAARQAAPGVAPAAGRAGGGTAATPMAGPAAAPPRAAGVMRAAPTAPVVSSTAELSAQRGAEAFTAGRFTQATRFLEAAIAQGRATYDLHMMLGRSYRQLSRPDTAVAQFERAAKLRPSAEAYYEAGLAEREAGRATEAQVAFTRARQLNPQDPMVAYQLGLACLEQGHLAQAEGELEAGLALQPEHPAILVALGRVCAARHQWEDASTMFRRAIDADPRDAGAYLDLGRALLALRRLNEATHTFEQAVQLAPDSAESQKALGMCYHAQGKRRQARRALQRATELDPGDVEARRLLKQI